MSASNMYTPSKNLTLVLYEDQTPTKCYEFKKGQVKWWISLTVLLLLLSITIILFTFFYIKNVTFALRDQGPIIQKQANIEKEGLSTKISGLEDSYKELERSYNTLLQKLKTAKPSSISLPLIATIPSSRDLSGDQLINTDLLKLSLLNNKLNFNFNLLSEKEKKISGHLFLLMKSQGIYFIYPQVTAHLTNSHKATFLTPFDFGEPFSVSRIRPVQGSFLWPFEKDKLSSTTFEVVIFSREGDLILKKSLIPSK